MNIGKVSVKVNNTGLESVARTNGNDATVKIMLVKGPKGDDGGGLPSGGTTGQVLVKHSDTSQDAEWKTLTASDVGALAADGKALTAGTADNVAHKLKMYVNSTEYDFDGSADKSLKYICTDVTVNANDWSYTTNADGYYYINLALSVDLNADYIPDVFCTGASSGVLPTTSEAEAYNLVWKGYLFERVLSLYAKTKPTTTFYIKVKGVAIS